MYQQHGANACSKRLYLLSGCVVAAGSNQVRPQALRQAQAAAARALSRPMPTDRTNDNGPTPGQDAPLEHDGMESGAADTTQHQGLLMLLCLSTNGPVVL